MIPQVDNQCRFLSKPLLHLYWFVSNCPCQMLNIYQYAWYSVRDLGLVNFHVFEKTQYFQCLLFVIWEGKLQAVFPGQVERDFYQHTMRSKSYLFGNQLQYSKAATAGRTRSQKRSINQLYIQNTFVRIHISVYSKSDWPWVRWIEIEVRNRQYLELEVWSWTVCSVIVRRCPLTNDQMRNR